MEFRRGVCWRCGKRKYRVQGLGSWAWRRREACPHRQVRGSRLWQTSHPNGERRLQIIIKRKGLELSRRGKRRRFSLQWFDYWEKAVEKKGRRPRAIERSTHLVCPELQTSFPSFPLFNIGKGEKKWSSKLFFFFFLLKRKEKNVFLGLGLRSPCNPNTCVCVCQDRELGLPHRKFEYVIRLPFTAPAPTFHLRSDSRFTIL